MKLLRAQVQKFRSIVDSEVVDIDERVTVIIGKNEQGKTTFLRGLSSFNPTYSYSPSDLPHHLRPELESKKSETIPIVTLWLAPDQKDKKALSSIVADVDKICTFKITRYFDAHYGYTTIDANDLEAPMVLAPQDISTYVKALKQSASTLKAKLADHGTRVSAFLPTLEQANGHIDAFLIADFTNPNQIPDLVKTITTALTGVPNQDAPIQADIATMSQEMQEKIAELTRLAQQDKVAAFHARIPKFVFHSTTLDQIPNDINIEAFLKDPENVSKGMVNLCRAAGLSNQKIQQLSAMAEASHREPYEDHHKAAISGAINEFWSQQSYTVYFRIERERLSVSIEDKTYGRRIPPSDRSDGFRWYLSFYSTLLNEVSSNVPTVLLLDNPGLELHPDGQRDIKRSIEEKHSSAMQVIYVTHSPAMIDVYDLEQVRRVDLLGNLQGSKVRRLEVKDGTQFDLLEPVRTAIGASLVTSLMTNKYNVLGEGAADRPILEAGVMLLTEDRDKVLVSGSVAESLEMLPSFFERANLRYIVYVDSDSGGRAIEAKLISADIPKEKIISLRSIFGDEKYPGVDFELEDVISDEFYAKAVAKTYPDKLVEVAPGGGPKRTARYETEFKRLYRYGFAKRRVAESIKKMAIKDGFDEESKANLLRVVTHLMGVLQAQP